MNITAIILSRQPISNKIKAKVPGGVRPLNFVSDIKSFKSYQRSWMMAVAEVATDWFFFFDDDDQLPGNIMDILARAVEMTDREGAALAYTNELIINDAGIVVESRKGAYSQDVHIRNPLLCHHLVLCRTSVAKEALLRLPRGDFMPEPMVYFEMAKKGAVWIDEIGYHWHRSAGGLHTHQGATAAQVAAVRWCHANRGATPVVGPLSLLTEVVPEQVVTKRESKTRKVKG